MTPFAVDLRSLEAASQGGTALRWSAAVLTVLTAYCAAIWLALSLPAPEGAEGEPQEAVMIELEPLTALEEAPPPAPEPEAAAEIAETAPTPEPKVEAPPQPPEPNATPEPTPPPLPPEPVVEPLPPEPAPPEPSPLPLPPEAPPQEPALPEPVVEEPPTPVEEPEPLPEPTTQEAVPDLTQTNAIAAAVLNPPIPTLRPPPPRPDVVAERKTRVDRPAPARPKPARPKPERSKPDRPKVERAKPERPRQAAERPAPPARSAAPRSDTRAASRSASAPRVSSASWQRQAVSHFRKYRRRLQTREKGTARVAVTIDRSGRVVGASLASSSGSAVLDGEALALVRRASPIPAPPEGVGGRTLSLTVPVSM
ncbi:hypothetical protein ASG43_04135 [Aureimonas sp. Leaf454]|uniref:energy transducer TonB family protein n=1 Tax=Aureimonas sp. Leaf454 TaxID=1736381 RepID=UPI0006FB64BD|nr:energy transducer TonB [Aureimonas sp. Leaf454]KQT54757.1 hypothetical protein ASG43_04135 [Aureimonas sp. Leaf454]